MADSPAVGSTRTPSRPTSQRSKSSTQSRPSSRTTEETPLLARESEYNSQDGEETYVDEGHSSAASSLLRRLNGSSKDKPKSKSRWPSGIALLVLCIVAILIMVLGFMAPESMEEYAKQAVVVKPTYVKPEELSAEGVRVRVKADMFMDASRVDKKFVRDFGRFGTWIAREAETDPSEVTVLLPEYGNVVLGTAKIPKIKVNIRNGHVNHVDFVTEAKLGELDGIRSLANDWITGNIKSLNVKAKANVSLKSGLIHLGKQAVEQGLLLEGSDVPSIPDYAINKLNVHEKELPDGRKGMAADVSITVANDYPIDFNVPPLRFGILVDNCVPSGKKIMVANATIGDLHIEPKTDLHVNVSGIIRTLPDALTNACPGKKDSPLDILLGKYIRGKDMTVYVRGSDSPSLETPKWITDLISGITVPVPFPGHSLDGLLKNFSMANLHFSLPSPFADPDTPEAQPKISATILALVGLPQEMNFPIDVNRIKAVADIYYHSKKLGKLDLHKWQHANSSRVEPHDGADGGLAVESKIKDAPVQILDDDVFAEVVQALIFGDKTIYLEVKAKVGVEMETTLGKFPVRQIPAEGVVPVKPVKHGNGNKSMKDLGLSVGNLQIVDTSETSLTIEANLNLTNPTNYSATVPYVDINILTNGTVLGHATITDIEVVPGKNLNIPVTAVWDPASGSGDKGKAVGRELLSQFISGYNTTLSLAVHPKSVPAQPALGKALQNLTFEFPTPSLRAPRKPDDPDNPDDPSDPDDPDAPKKDGPHFIQGATMHLFSSTAIFTLLSPFSSTTLYLTHINATSFYKDDDVGEILYDLPFAVPPGRSESPRLPVKWSLGSVGYEAMRKALGGQLKLRAEAEVGVRIGEWNQGVWFRGGSIGAKVRI